VDVMKKSGALRGISSIGLWFCCLLFLMNSATAADHPAFQPVKELFAAMSKHDGKAMQETATEDFQLLEHGEDWTMQRLIEAVQPKGKPYVRKNFFNQIRARETGDVAWVSYWNKAEIQSEGGMRTIVWLESAVVVKEGDRWKIQLLHSTRVDPDRHPKNIDWIQFDATP
jgi:ketosteroid isomerase-like protein